MSFWDSKSSKLYIGTTDVSPYTTGFSGIPGERTLAEITTFADSGQKSIPSIENPTAQWDALYNHVGGDSFDFDLSAMKSDSDGTPLLYFPGGDTRTDPGYGAGVVFVRGYSYRSQVGNAVALQSPIQVSGIVQPVISLHNAGKNTFTASGNNTSIDDGAATSDGGSWYYIVFDASASGGNAEWDLTFQDSADDSNWATVATVSVSTAASARVTFTGTLRRYVRVIRQLDATSGEITWISAYYRG